MEDDALGRHWGHTESSWGAAEDGGEKIALGHPPQQECDGLLGPQPPALILCRDGELSPVF